MEKTFNRQSVILVLSSPAPWASPEPRVEWSGAQSGAGEFPPIPAARRLGRVWAAPPGGRAGNIVPGEVP